MVGNEYLQIGRGVDFSAEEIQSQGPFPLGLLQEDLAAWHFPEQLLQQVTLQITTKVLGTLGTEY